jgi:hypothetical protein
MISLCCKTSILLSFFVMLGQTHCNPSHGRSGCEHGWAPQHEIDITTLINAGTCGVFFAHVPVPKGKTSLVPEEARQRDTEHAGDSISQV